MEKPSILGSSLVLKAFCLPMYKKILSDAGQKDILKRLDKEDMLRAVIEGISLNLSVVVDLYKKKYIIDKMTIVGGSADATWSQICADNVSCNKINHEREATSIGAAVAAGLGIGVYDQLARLK